jgi:type III secretion protein C
MKARLAATLLAAALGAGLGQGASAASLNWNTRPFSIMATDKPLPDFLRELAASQGTTAVIDPKVTGTLSGKFTASAQTILNNLCATNGLTWYHDGSFLFVEPAGEARTEVMAISSGSGARITETLNRLRIADPRYPLTISERDGTLYVSGPKRYVEMVRQAVRMADQRAVLGNYAEVRIFPLRYAWATDFTVKRGGSQITVPGVANVLRGVHARSSASGTAAAAGGTPSMPFKLGPNRVIKLRSGESVNAPKVEMSTGPGDGSGDEPAFNFAPDADLPQFHADARMNAVMVRDMPDRMAQHARLIEAMDARPLLIEIELTIMDISSDTLNSLGIDWRLHGGRGDFQSGDGTQPRLTFGGTAAGAGGAATPAGGVFSATIGHEARTFLLTRVNALTKSGQANFIARPRVLTLNNSEAVLENMNELHVRVNGFQDAGLFNITAGTAMRIMPMMVDEGSDRGVMMSIHIDDADLSEATVDAIPIVRRRAVDTQALVAEGTSLLIAGYSSEEKTSITSGVPLLSRLPLVGTLFKTTERKQVNMERFYLLTPRLVAMRATAATVPPRAPAPPAELPALPPREPGSAPAVKPSGREAVPGNAPSNVNAMQPVEADPLMAGGG